MARRTFAAAATAVTALLAGAVPASALTIEAQGGPQDRFEVAGAGATNEHLRISVAGRVVTFTRVAGTPLTIGAQNAGGKCAVTIADTVITCVSSTDAAGLELELGSGHDTLEFDTTLGIFAVLFEPALIFGSGNDTLRLDTVYNGQSVFAIGGDGLDTVDFSGRAAAVNATLRPGDTTIQGESMRPYGFEQMIGSTGNDVLAADGGLIRGGPGNDELRANFARGDDGDDTLIGTGGNGDLYGGPGNDVLRGEAGADYLLGDAGDDLLIGGSGTDGFDGGAGTDIVSYQDRNVPVSVTLDNSSNDGEPGEAEYVWDEHVEGVRGGSGDDTLIGGAKPDRLEGGGGNDRLDGRGAGDALLGGEGVDTADYSAHPAAVTVSLDALPNDGVPGEADNAVAETVQGSALNDTLVGSGASESLRGGPGNDTLQGGGGADLLDGEAGTDTASYAERSAADPVTVTLDGNADDGSTGEGDRALTENVRGGASADLLVGGGGANALDGGAGADTLDGGPGADELAGGDGVDTVTYFARSAPVSASLNDAADDGVAGEQDRVRADVEQLQGGTGNDSLSGDGGGNLLLGGSGDDVLDGAEGPDRLEGGEGADLLVGGGGADSFLGGAGADTLSAFDGLPDDVDCGADVDAATVDTGDAVKDCEGLTMPGVVPVPAPPANPDPDGDGSLVPADCNEGDPKIKPGAFDVPNDRVDQDCSGADGAYARITSPVSNAWLSSSRGSVLRRLRISDVPAGGRVEVRCTVPRRAPKSACPFSRRSFTPKRGTVNALSAFKRKRLRVGTVVEVRVTAPLSIGRVVRFTVKRRAVSPARTLCLQPGASKPARCS